MDDTLQRLLDAEMKAESLAGEAEQARERTIRAATVEVRELDEAFTAKIPALQQTWIARSEERAVNSIAEIERRYDERHERLRDLAAEREDEALSAGFRILMDSGL